MTKLAIIGASGHGKVAADIAGLCGWLDIHFYDDAWPTKQDNGPWPVKGTSADLLETITEYDGVFVAIGNNQTRFEKLQALPMPAVTLIHPSAVVSRYANLGSGCVVMANAVVNADARIAEGCIVNTSATVDHDCQLAECVHISPGANLAGGVAVGKYSWVGIGACVKQLVQIGEFVTIGAGAVVIKNISNNSTVAGNPAKPI